jgi:hypothetical protein
MSRFALTAAASLVLSTLGGPAGAQTLPGFTFQAFKAPAIANAASCSTTVNATALIGKVQFAQTHLFETTHPFFHLSAQRHTAVRVSVTGSGAAPAVQVTARANGITLGSLCLSGPATLPASVDENAPSAATSFLGNLPADWVVPGLELTVSAGSSIRLVTAGELKIGAAPTLTFVTMDWLLWGDTQPTALPANFGNEFAARLPITAIQHSVFPRWPAVSQLPISPRTDGNTPTGSATSHPALIATGKSHCTLADKTAGTCTLWSGYGVLDAVRSMTGQIQAANGLDMVSHWYGALGVNSRAGGGLGGGVVASGDDYSLTFNHEFGHAFDQPHWGASLYSVVAAGATQVHPYTGQYLTSTGTPNGGGYGNTWAFDPQVPGYLINPVCPGTGKERQEPMQRNGSACVSSGMVYDYFSDYAALFIHRYFNGATSVYAGNVSSPRDRGGNTLPPFSFPTKGGRPNLALSADGSAPALRKWNPATSTYDAFVPTGVVKDMKYPAQWNVPVYTLWGSFSSATPEATTIQTPLAYTGHLKRLFDPTNATDFSAIKASISGDSFWWGADLVVRADFDNGSFRHVLVPGYARGTTTSDGSTFRYWAVNIPVVTGAKLTRVSLYHRPMEVRYSDGGKTTSSYYTATNLNSTLNSTLTAATYLNAATLVKTLDLPGGL